MSNLTDLFNAYLTLEKPPILMLQNKNHLPVAAIRLDKLKYTNIVVNEEINYDLNSEKEKYYILLEDTAVGIFFTYFQKLNS